MKWAKSDFIAIVHQRIAADTKATNVTLAKKQKEAADGEGYGPSTQDFTPATVESHRLNRLISILEGIEDTAVSSSMVKELGFDVANIL